MDKKILFENIYQNIQASERNNSTSADKLMLALFDQIEEYINVIKDIVSKGGILNESGAGNITSTKVNKITEEVERIFTRINSYLNPSKGQKQSVPNVAETNELVSILNDQIPLVLSWMKKVFRNNPKNGVRIYDENDKINMNNSCIAFKTAVDRLRTLIAGISGNYDLPNVFELPCNL